MTSLRDTKITPEKTSKTSPVTGKTSRKATSKASTKPPAAASGKTSVEASVDPPSKTPRRKPTEAPSHQDSHTPSSPKKKMRVALAAWEIGRVNTGLGAKVGGLGVVVEELPAELIKAAALQNLELEVVTLSPCFAYHAKEKLRKLAMALPVTLDGQTFEFEAYEHVFPDGQKVVYFWDHLQLHWTTPSAIYPSDPQLALRLYASVAQAMAGYIKQSQFDTVHLHDYHIGLIPFYLGDDYLRNTPVHLTIHNATYQGNVAVAGKGYAALDQIHLPGRLLFHKYFDFFDNINIMKGCMLKVHETWGKITTVSGDLDASWGYAAELKLDEKSVVAKAAAQKNTDPVEVFLPNRGLDLFEKLPIIGITNGIADQNRPENLPELTAKTLQKWQAALGPSRTVFRNAITQDEMLARDHSFDESTLSVKTALKRLLHLETFGVEPMLDPILITAVGRLVEQKNLGLVGDIIERTLLYDPGVKFVILASAPEDDLGGKALETLFARLASKHPHHVYFNNQFNLPLSKLILAGGDFTLIPSRFEPCGLVDYEASLLGNIVIGRATGGLTKVSRFAYLYEWLDIGDREGEANAFFWQIQSAIQTYRHQPARHLDMIHRAMRVEASWDLPARQYINMFRYGLIMKQWHRDRANLISSFISALHEERSLFFEFFLPARGEYADHFDWELKKALSTLPLVR